MDVPQLLEASSLLVPEAVATENDITVNDVWEYLAHDEWEVALDLLEELGDVHPLPLTFRQTLATAAEQMQLDRGAAWCHRRCFETRNGILSVVRRAGVSMSCRWATLCGYEYRDGLAPHTDW
ncbi:hypothetical protein ACPCA8_09105 [Streptomyces capoamus]|uniref:hypothetical protein n=1 Tax=Streptomyces capoamus TaxID=68183 RepID=UPI003C2FC242